MRDKLLGADGTVVHYKSGLGCRTGSARPLVLLELVLGDEGRPGLLVPGDSGHEDPVLVVGGPGVATHQLAVAAGSDDAGLGAEAKLGAEGDGTGFIIETARDSLVDMGSSLARRRSVPGRSRGQGRTGAWAGWPGSSG